MVKKIIFNLCYFLSVTFLLQAQEMYEIPLHTSIQQADVVIEGKVLSSKASWDKNHTFIYTTHQLEVHKILKGDVSTDVIELVTKGGQVGDDLIVVTHTLSPQPNEKGLFFLKNLPDSKQFRAYADRQGFLRYQGDEAIAPFKSLQIAKLFQEVTQATGEPFRTIKTIKEEVIQTENKRTEAITITSFSPTTIRAGTQEVLTIRGSGFGVRSSTSGVFFSNSDDGGQSLLGSGAYLISWTDTEIQTYVPSFAGTGIFRIRNANNERTDTPSELVVPYSIVEQPDQNDGKFKLPKLADLNDNGGYTISFSNTMSNQTGATESFRRALQTWKCTKNINFQTSTETQDISAVSRDEFNIVTFDTNNTLSEGVLGAATSYYNGCSINGGAGQWSLREFDIIFSNQTSWYFGDELPNSSQSDFETTALHEIGHTVQLAHIIDPTDVMHYSSTGGFVRRNLSPVNQEATDYVLTQSSATNTCGPSPMTLLFNCETNSTSPPPKALFVIDRSQICVGDSLHLTDRSQNATSRIWTFEGGNPPTSTQVSQGINYPNAGHYQITLTAIGEGGQDTVSTTSFITVSDNPTVDLGEDITVCASEQVVLRPLNPEADFSYEWSDGSTESSLAVTKSGLYKLTVIQNGCRVTDQVQVVINPIPEAGWTFEVDNENTQKVQFNSQAKNAPSLVWDFGDGRTSTELNPTHTYQSGGTYQVTQTVINLCGSHQENKFITIEENTVTTALENQLDNEIRIFPNPTKGKFQIHFNKSSDLSKVKVFDVFGHQILHQELSQNTRNLEIDLENQSKGIYFLVIEKESQKYTRKLVVY